MKSALIIRHLAFENLGTLESVLEHRGYELHTVDATLADLTAIDIVSPDLVVVLGGPIGAFDEQQYPFLMHELALVRKRLDSGRKILGICLGAQLIARVLGSQVGSMGVKEIGFAPVTLTEKGQRSYLAPLAEGWPVLHWHGDQFQIPVGAQRLAGTAICPNQAFSMGSAVLGLQFHLEVDPLCLEPWLVGHAAELGVAGIEPVDLRDQAQALGARLAPIAQGIFCDWLDLA
ncbi:glutamine amidotransferase [Pseudomonas abieticivorans]|uniref:glutamine amidotransferase n=1 Tax=Pseudomonas abieticivorans TaxID=2931382 RepID=UPI0020C11C03|nr:glutamine amidotransferase [Pseudomonas sp. PIA16]